MTDDTKPSFEQVVTGWHAGLVGRDGNRGARAGLRRCQSADEVFDIPAFYGLHGPLVRLGYVKKDLIVARIALAVAEIETDLRATGEGEAGAGAGAGDGADDADPGTLGAAFVGPDPNQPRVSPGRLRLLANTEEPDLFLRLLRGMISMIDRTAPIGDTAETVRNWHYPSSRERARRKLLLSYFTHVSPKALEKENA